MPKNTVRFIDFRALKSAVKMQQVLDHYRLTDQFKPGNDSLTGPCPIHKGTHATQFRVSISKNCWNCFSDCHCGGNVLDFVAKMEKVDTNEAANRMVEWFNLDIEKLNAESERAKHQPNPNRESANKQVHQPDRHQQSERNRRLPRQANPRYQNLISRSDLCSNWPTSIRILRSAG